MKIKEMFDSKVAEIARMSDMIDWNNKVLYCKWLNQQYYLIQNTSRYLALAASMVKLEKNEEFNNFIHHLNEELDHDKAILKDMRALGWTELEPVSPQIRALIASQYYDIQANGPESLMGYALMLEGLSVARCKTIADVVERAHGKKSTYLRLHESADSDHYPEGIARVEKMPVDRQAVVIQNLEMMADLYVNFLSCVCSVQKNDMKRAG